jgi:hypothetical protein
MSAKLERAKLDAAQLLAHLQAKSSAAPKNSEHYRALARTAEEIGATLSSMSAPLRLDALGAELATLEAALVPLTKQPPYTLLVMRVVEIGLPFLACCLSLLFIFRYALTEARSREIKALLEQRQAEHS